MLSNPLLVGVLALLIGTALGVFLGRTGFGAGLRQRRLEQQLDELRSEYTRYQAQVNEHFMESAHLVRRFNDAYRDVNQHMARGASRLCHDEDWLEELEQDRRAKLEQHGEDDGFEPPRDYAPKADPEEKGTLSEEFGFEGSREKA